jgi:hypothetical protein
MGVRSTCSSWDFAHGNNEIVLISLSVYVVFLANVEVWQVN